MDEIVETTNTFEISEKFEQSALEYLTRALLNEHDSFKLMEEQLPSILNAVYHLNSVRNYAGNCLNLYQARLLNYKKLLFANITNLYTTQKVKEVASNYLHNAVEQKSTSDLILLYDIFTPHHALQTIAEKKSYVQSFYSELAKAESLKPYIERLFNNIDACLSPREQHIGLINKFLEHCSSLGDEGKSDSKNYQGSAYIMKPQVDSINDTYNYVIKSPNKIVSNNSSNILLLTRAIANAVDNYRAEVHIFQSDRKEKELFQKYFAHYNNLDINLH